MPAGVRGFWRSAAEDQGRLALIEPEGARISAGALVAHSNQLVHALRARGAATGDVVATLLPNGAPMLEALGATMQAGWYITPLNTHLAAPEIAYVLRDSGAIAFLAHEKYAEQARRAADEAGLPPEARFAVGRIEGFRCYADELAAQPTSAPEERRAGQFLQYTSGTTGRPKGIKRALGAATPADAQAIAYARASLGRFGFEPGGDGVFLVTSPMYHTAPLAYGWFALNFDYTVVMMEHWDSEQALALIERYRVTSTHMVPTQFHRLLQLPDETRRRYDSSSLRFVLHAAAPCPPEVKRRMLEWWGPVVYEYYGATEGGGTLATPEQWLRFPGTVGKAWEGHEVRIYDDEGKLCPPGQVGTVYLKLMGDFEYRGDSDKTSKNRIGNFFTVGDVGWLNEEGFLFLCDRKIDMIISGGVNIYPAEIEAVLLGHPAVGDVAVFGIPDAEWGEQVKAVVEPTPGATPSEALARDLLEHCFERLAKYKCPRSIDFSTTLPRDPNGKLYKRLLREPYWQGRERRI